jgi:hypothetical protein
MEQHVSEQPICGPSAEDLRDSVRDYRDPATPVSERGDIREWWREQGVANQFAAMLRAAEIDGAEK